MRSLIVILIFTLAIQARAVQMDTVSLHVRIKDKEFSTIVTREQVSKTPAWNLRDDFPPLSPRKAERAAITKFHQLLKGSDDWERKRITLESIGDETHWYYVVEFAPIEPQLGPRTSLEIIVLMDGTVVDPKVEDAK